MINFDVIFNCIYLAVLGYQVLYFLVQYAVLKRIELFYYSMFLLTLVLYYSVYVFHPILSSQHGPFIKLVLTAPEMVFMVSLTFFYIQFLTNYLELHRHKLKLYYLIKYYSWYNVVLFFVFLLMSFFKIESKNVFAMASLLTMPVNLAMLIMTWRISSSSVYAKVAAYAITCAVIGELICHLLIHSGTDTYALYGGNAFIPAQVGVLLDVFILGYGLSLKAAESDKKLVQTLLENQQIVETERSRLAKDLHDGLGGLLSGIKLTLNSVADKIPEKNTALFTKAGNQLDTAIREMRRVAHNMMPEALLKFGLGEAIQDYCDGINESNVVKMKYTQIGSLQMLDQSTEIVLYRIIQELTNNALKHAAAKNIFVQITTHEQGLSITVEDDGKGFAVKELPDAGGSGLRNVAARVDYLKGSIDIKTEEASGCSITMEVPFFHGNNKSA